MARAPDGTRPTTAIASLIAAWQNQGGRREDAPAMILGGVSKQDLKTKEL